MKIKSIILSFAAVLLTTSSVAQSEDAALAGLFDDWGDNIIVLREERLGKSFAFKDPAAPDADSLYYKAKEANEPTDIFPVIEQFREQLEIPVRFPDIDPLQEATPIHIAAVFNDNPAILGALVEYGGDIDATEHDNGATALHAALYADRPLAIIQKLVELGADINATLPLGEYEGMTPLHIAAAKTSRPEVIVYLVKNGANPEATFKYGFFSVTPQLALAKKGKENVREHPEVQEVLAVL